MNNQSSQTPQTKKTRKFLFTIISIVILLIILVFVYMRWFSGQIPSLSKEVDMVNTEIVDNIKNIKEGHYSSWPIISWDTFWYGRIYAQICSAPFEMFPCGCRGDEFNYITGERVYDCYGCLDGGINFYDRKGKFVANCNSGWGDEIKSGYSCLILTSLNYRDADYFSDTAIANCPQLQNK